ncbi:DUF881 domain-containing protein [Ornithinimicrobium pratense]|uniref:DUF881 domain-containing protein n=1 Tax=Ornithinimicrobium pratense TaxID=2593973 RepID=A0A5J6V3R3_9MICO|nr:DUF881 domain-containing protein [Ornithinimicrobium pratense]QFG68590.1 DUF881 domain-containing protein [Ornithinimicrobium pratense]
MTWPHRPRARSEESAGPPATERDPAASMALLEEVLDPPVGPGYRSAADHRVEQGLPPSSGTRTWLMLAVSVLLGLLVTAAATTLGAQDEAAAKTRTQLVERIEAAQTAGDGHRETVDQLRADISALEQRAVDPESASAGPGEPQSSAARRIAAAGLEAGAMAVQGPGVIVRLGDAAPREVSPGEVLEPERINSRDIQLVVNGLWSAGAEAISVNGHRMTSTSAIRFAGKAIIVDFRGLTPPYEILAIGEPARLTEETSTGMVGAYLGELRDHLGLRAEVEQVDLLTIGAAERLTTRVSSVGTNDLPADPSPGEPAPSPEPDLDEEDR